MLQRLSIDEMDMAWPLFADAEKLHLAILSSFSHESSADVYVDDSSHPEAALLVPWNKKRIYVAGTEEKWGRELSQEITELFSAPSCSPDARKMSEFVIVPTSKYCPQSSQFLNAIQCFRSERQCYRVQPDNMYDQDLPAGFVLRKVDNNIISETSLVSHYSLLS